MEQSATECQATKRKIIPSLPTCSVAAVAIVIDCASTIFPITPPQLLAAHISTGSMPSCCEVILCRLPKSALAEVSLPVSATPSQPRKVPKKGYNHPVRVKARPSTASRPEYRVTYPSPSMNEIAIMARRIRTSVRQKIFSNRTGLCPSNNPETIAAKKQPVPVAESQLKSYLAASGVGFGTTGAAREMALRKYGTAHPGGPGRTCPLGSTTRNACVGARFISSLILGNPHSSTNSERIAK